MLSELKDPNPWDGSHPDLGYLLGSPLQDLHQTPDGLSQGHSLQHSLPSGRVWGSGALCRELGLCILEAPTLEGVPGCTSLVLSFPS